MAKDFVKLSEVTVLEEVTDNASVLVEQDGEIYRAPKTQVGGAGGVKTAIIRDSMYLEVINGVQQPKMAEAITYECLNMTFEEAYETMLNGEPLTVVGMLSSEAAMNLQGMLAFLGTLLGVPCISMMFGFGSNIIAQLYWTADGLSVDQPSQPE